jgi:mannose-6-phosphate isomerase-like protein (cupin superfamily)
LNPSRPSIRARRTCIHSERGKRSFCDIEHESNVELSHNYLLSRCLRIHLRTILCCPPIEQCFRIEYCLERVLNFKSMKTHEVALTKGEGRSIWLLGDLYTFKFSGEALSVTELTAFPQNGPPPHIHLREDESFSVLDGEFSVLLGERTLTAGQGAFVHIPKGTLHTYKNIGSTPGRMIILLTPGGFERLWEELGEPATQLTTPPPVDAGVIEKLIALAPNYHLQIPPPPR